MKHRQRDYDKELEAKLYQAPHIGSRLQMLLHLALQYTLKNLDEDNLRHEEIPEFPKLNLDSITITSRKAGIYCYEITSGAPTAAEYKHLLRLFPKPTFDELWAVDKELITNPGEDHLNDEDDEDDEDDE